ncbi:amidase [Nocardia sp. NPDC020380]|uniref:amidase n=1 Tax=Nocardia sp. NPDC020380 TaxID=3364309 RepID=UPI0037B26C62
MSDNEELCWMPAVELSRHIAAREITPLEVAEAVLRRIEEVNPALNALVFHQPDQVIRDAKILTEQLAGGAPAGPLHGIPYSLKEGCAAEGTPATSGIVAHRDRIADRDEPVAARLKSAGGLFLGKTNAAEAGYCALSKNHLYGATHNAWKHGYTAGGSSSGAGAAVAAGLGQLAQGTDGGGSVRIPAAVNGVVGFKPSLGRIPQTRLPGRFHSFIFHGPITRTVGDAALMMNAVAGFDPGDPLSLPTDGVDYLTALDTDIDRTRIAWSPDLGFADVDPEIVRLCEQALTAFEDLGCVVEQAHPGWEHPGRVMWESVWAPTYAAMLDAADWDAQTGQVDEQLLAVMHEGASLSVRQVQRADAARGLIFDQFSRFMQSFDFFVTPVTTMQTFPVDDFCPAPLAGAPLTEQILGWLLTYPFNLTTTPVISVPVGFTSAGLPVGLQIAGRLRADFEVLSAAAAFERARPWAQHRPVIE